MGEAEGDPDPGGGDFEGRVTWELVGDGQAMVTLREGTVWAIRSSDATIVDTHIDEDGDENSMGSFFRYCQSFCVSRDEDMEMLAWMCKLVEGSLKDYETKDWSQLALRSSWHIQPPQWALDREAAGDNEPQQEFNEVEESDGVKGDGKRGGEGDRKKYYEKCVEEEDVNGKCEAGRGGRGRNV